MYEKRYIGRDLTGFENRGTARPVSRVTLLDDDSAVTAGDDTGLELTAECPNASQALAETILERLKGYRYQRFSASAANLDPKAELGDGLTAGGVYGILARLDSGGDGYPDLEAPGPAELEEEFPMEGPLTRAFRRKLAGTRAVIAKTAEEITLLVENTEKGLTASLEQTATDIRQEVSDTEQALRSSIRLNADAIALRVEKSGVISAINQSAEEVAIQAGRISLEGLVTVNRSFQIDKDGSLRCSGGTVGGFTVGTAALYNGLSSFDGKANGVYVGTDGIALGGGKFRVDSLGNLTASSGTFTGTVYANMIRAGGDAGYITGSQIGSGTIGGGNIAGETIGEGNMGTDSIPNRCIQAGSIFNSTVAGSAGIVKGKFSQEVQNLLADIAGIQTMISSTLAANKISAYEVDTSFLKVNTSSAGWKSATVATPSGGSVTINYLGR